MHETWPIIWPTADKPAGSTELHEAAAQQMAQAILWANTGRRFGVNRVVEQYSVRTWGECAPWPSWAPPPGRGLCGVGGPIELEGRPVQLVHSVTVDGVAAASWWLEGSALWPAVNAPWASLTSDNPQPRVEVDYSFGIPLAGSEWWGAAALAMGEVAFELLSGMCGGSCKLPSRVTSITRQGVTVTFGDAPEQWNLLGLPLADTFIRAVNPHGLQQRSSVHSPDMPVASTRRTVLPGATNIGGVTTAQLDPIYQGDPYSFTVTFPDASYLAGGTGVVAADLKAVLGGPVVASFTPSISDAILTLSLDGATTGDLDAGVSLWLDVSVAGTTWVQKMLLEVKAEVSV